MAKNLRPGFGRSSRIHSRPVESTVDNPAPNLNPKNWKKTVTKDGRSPGRTKTVLTRRVKPPAVTASDVAVIKAAVQELIHPDLAPIDYAPLSPREAAFVDHYMVNFNATQAVIKAGYSKASASYTGSTLLRNPKVHAEIRKRRAIAAARYGVTRDRLTRTLACVAFASAKDFIGPGNMFIPIADMTDEEAEAIAEVTIEEFTDGRSDKRQVRRTKYKMASKLDAVEMLGRDIGMFDDGSGKRQEDQLGLMARILDQVDAAGRAERAKVIEHNPNEPQR